MAVKNGKEYTERIDRQQINLWVQGEPVKGLLSRHPAFSGLIQSQAEMYDMQHHKQTLEQMTYVQEDGGGERFGLSFLAPRSREDLISRRIMMELWAEKHHGFLGRSPDYMNTALMSLYTASDLLQEYDPEYAINLKGYYEYCRSRDITLSHAFIQPFASRWSEQADEIEDSIAAKIIDRQENGIVVSGAFMMATQAATCDEILVLPTPAPAMLEDNPFAFAFAVPNDLEGITFICRDSCAASSSFDYPLSSRFEEMDAMVIFDRVFIPRNRIFYLGRQEAGDRLFSEGNFHSHAGHQVITRYIAKTEFMLGLISRLADEQYIAFETVTIDRIARILMMLENLKSLRLAAETLAEPDRNGYYVPAKKPLAAATMQYPSFYQEMLGMLQDICSSSLIMNPSEQDLNSSAGGYIQTYLKGPDLTACGRIALFRLAWELGAGPFGGRQKQFEHFFFGNPRTIAARMYGLGNLDKYKQMINEFLNIPCSVE